MFLIYHKRHENFTFLVVTSPSGKAHFPPVSTSSEQKKQRFWSYWELHFSTDLLHLSYTGTGICIFCFVLKITYLLSVVKIWHGQKVREKSIIKCNNFWGTQCSYGYGYPYISDSIIKTVDSIFQQCGSYQL